MEVVVQALPVINPMGRQVMQTPEDVAQMLRLKAAGLGIKSIALRMGCSKNTVRRYLRGGGWVAYRRPEHNSAPRGLEPWLAERLQRHHGNADVVRQDLEREHSIALSLRTVEQAVAPFGRELRAAEVATIRFETAPGEQLQSPGVTRKVGGTLPSRKLGMRAVAVAVCNAVPRKTPTRTSRATAMLFDLAATLRSDEEEYHRGACLLSFP